MIAPSVVPFLAADSRPSRGSRRGACRWKTASGGLSGFRHPRAHSNPRPTGVCAMKPAEGLTQSVLDRMDYGLSEPQMVLLQDGSVFLAGQVQAPMDPKVTAQPQGLRVNAADNVDATFYYGNGVAGTVDPSIPYVMVKEVQWDGGITLSSNWGKQAIEKPSWKYGINVNEVNYCSTRPGVYLASTAYPVDTFTVKIHIGAWKKQGSTQTSVTGRLMGSLGDDPLGGIGTTEIKLKFEQVSDPIPMSDGDPSIITMRITNLPPGVRWYRGEANWKMLLSNGSEMQLESTRLEVFVICDAPCGLFKDPTKHPIWKEALRMLCKNSNIAGAVNPQDTLVEITRYLHTGFGMHYDSTYGYAHFGLGRPINGRSYTFNLSGYIQKDGVFYVSTEAQDSPRNVDLNNDKSLVNCYDQAAAVKVFAATVGINCIYKYNGCLDDKDPKDVNVFGVIGTTNVVGRGMCNNPFFNNEKYDPALIVNGWPLWPGTSKAKRSYFGNHAFIGAALVDKDTTEHIFDACAGPHLGKEDLITYENNSLDPAIVTYGTSIPANKHTTLDADIIQGVR